MNILDLPDDIWLGHLLRLPFHLLPHNVTNVLLSSCFEYDPMDTYLDHSSHWLRNNLEWWDLLPLRLVCRSLNHRVVLSYQQRPLESDKPPSTHCLGIASRAFGLLTCLRTWVHTNAPHSLYAAADLHHAKAPVSDAVRWWYDELVDLNESRLASVLCADHGATSLLRPDWFSKYIIKYPVGHQTHFAELLDEPSFSPTGISIRPYWMTRPGIRILEAWSSEVKGEYMSRAHVLRDKLDSALKEENWDLADWVMTRKPFESSATDCGTCIHKWFGRMLGAPPLPSSYRDKPLPEPSLMDTVGWENRISPRLRAWIQKHSINPVSSECHGYHYEDLKFSWLPSATEDTTIKDRFPGYLCSNGVEIVSERIFWSYFCKCMSCAIYQPSGSMREPCRCDGHEAFTNNKTFPSLKHIIHPNLNPHVFLHAILETGGKDHTCKTAALQHAILVVLDMDLLSWLQAFIDEGLSPTVRSVIDDRLSQDKINDIDPDLLNAFPWHCVSYVYNHLYTTYQRFRLLQTCTRIANLSSKLSIFWKDYLEWMHCKGLLLMRSNISTTKTEGWFEEITKTVPDAHFIKWTTRHLAPD